MAAAALVCALGVVEVGVAVKDEDDPDVRKRFEAVGGVGRHAFFELEVAARAGCKTALSRSAAALAKAGANAANWGEIERRVVVVGGGGGGGRGGG